MESQGKENCVKLFQLLWWVILSHESLRLEQVPRRHHKGSITNVCCDVSTEFSTTPVLKYDFSSYLVFFQKGCFFLKHGTAIAIPGNISFKAIHFMPNAISRRNRNLH